MGELKKLSFDEVLSCLEKVEQHGEKASALCPAHTDNKQSLSITRGNNGEAVCNCFAGCSQRAIFDAIYMRLNTSPTFEDDKPIKPKRAAKKSSSRKEVARYNYIDENGTIINTKIRYDNKDFIWAEKGKQNIPLFNLNDVIEKNPIFIVEGEKDVLTLKNHGFGATNMKDGFTSENVSRYLSGKDIILTPDNDKSGFEYACKALNLLIGTAKSIKVILLDSLWADMPEKADITDFVEHNGSIEQIIEQAKNTDDYKKGELEQIIKERYPNPKADSSSSNHPHAAIWNNIEGFGLNKKNQLCYIKNSDEKTPLCHGSIIITEVIYNNDGMNENDISYKCDGVSETLNHLSEAVIKGEDFPSLKWIAKSWGCSCIPFGSQSTIRRLVEAIMLTGESAKITRQISHTGFVLNDDGKPIAYLHAGGSIGAHELICELGDELQQYTLPGCSSTPEERKAAFDASLSLLQAHRESVTHPLLSLIYMAALSQINRDVNGECGFCLYLRGKSQNGKSTLAALAMSHFGKFTSTTPPTSFESTWNRNELLSFILKDSILWIDDFHPKGSKAARDSQNEQFNRIARAAGDRAFRGRLNSNSEMKKSYIPRCLYLVTGEDEPQLSQSGLARIFTIDVKTERKNLSEVLEASRNGTLARAMADYILYIIENYKAVKGTFSSLYSKVIKGTRESIGENRLSIQAALLITSFDMWLYYAFKSNFIDKDHAEELSHKNRTIIMKLAQKIANEIEQSDPAEKFITALASMISNREVETRDIHYPDGDNELFDERTRRIGWHDEKMFYLDPEKAFSAVKQKLESVDDSIGITMKGLYRELSDMKKITADGSRGYTKLKRINGKPKPVIWIERKILEST